MNPIGKPSRSKVGFADLYLERYASGPAVALPAPDPDLFMIVCIPAFREPDLVTSLNSLLSCNDPGVKWEVLININYPENSSADTEEVSRLSWHEVETASRGLTRQDVRIHCLWNPDIPLRHAGVGLARKMAMDQAVRRFNSIGRPEGVVVSYDADTTCNPNYLKTIAAFYRQNPTARTANIYFEHPLSGSYEPRYYQSIAQYELYLRYMRFAVEQTGHPHAIHTVGSAFSLRCKTYIRVNGMGRDKAGEDFYFLHKCIHLKNFWEINETEVWPSVRESDRVIFGTGASIHRQLQVGGMLEVYHFDSFNPLTELFSKVGVYWSLLSGELELSKAGQLLESGWEAISPGLAVFLNRRKATQRILEMHHDSACEQTFRDKFFAWFNGFMILKYLNEVHQGSYVKSPVLVEASRLAGVLGIREAESTEGLLAEFRNFEKARGNRKVI